MNESLIIARTEDFVKEQLGQDTTGHDWWHCDRVRNTAAEIAQIESADVFVCTMAALLHDVADEKLNPSKEEGLLKVRTWLSSNLTDEQQINHIMMIIETMSFSGGGENRCIRLKAKWFKMPIDLMRLVRLALPEPLFSQGRKVVQLMIQKCLQEMNRFKRSTGITAKERLSIIFMRSY